VIFFIAALAFYMLGKYVWAAVMLMAGMMAVVIVNKE